MDLSTGIACLSLFVSLGACIYTRRSVIVARDAISTANKPVIRVWVDGGNKTKPESFTFYIENNGNGPAIVDSIEYGISGIDFTSDLFGLFRFYLNDLIYHNLEKSYVIGKDTKTSLVSLNVTKMNDLERSRAYQEITRLWVNIRYHTIYDASSRITLHL